jgi:type I restriction enzyme S subunit
MSKVKLGDIADIITGPFGSVLHKSDYVAEGFPLIMPQNIGDRVLYFDDIARISDIDADRLKKYEVFENNIVYARRGNVEKHAFIVTSYGRCFCGTGCLRVRINSEEAIPMYVSFYLSRPESREWISKQAVGANMPNINTEILSNICIELPTIDEQRKIVHILKSLEDRRLNNNAINDNLPYQSSMVT